MTALPYLYIPGDSMIPLVCPARLTADYRVEFRQDALNALESAAAAGESVVMLDLSGVVELDASGLGVLILLQKRARERGLRTRLLALPSMVERLLEETHMGALFDIDRSTSSSRW
jgi:anti-anti-sigma factor